MRKLTQVEICNTSGGSAQFGTDWDNITPLLPGLGGNTIDGTKPAPVITSPGGPVPPIFVLPGISLLLPRPSI